MKDRNNRTRFWRRACGFIVVLAALQPALAEPTIDWDPSTGRAKLENGRLELIVETQNGINARSLRDVRSSLVLADRDYSWPGGAFPKLTGTPRITQTDNRASIVLVGQLGDLEVEQRFEAFAEVPDSLNETLIIRNTAGTPAGTAGFKCGFAKSIRQNSETLPEARAIRFCPLPYRRETNGQIQEFPLGEVAEHGTSYAGWAEPAHPSAIWGSEGWVWSKGPTSVLLAKYNAESMEWSLMEPEKRGDETVVRFGGAGQWKYGHPEAATRLQPGASCTFGETHIEITNGDWKQAYYAYRDYVESKGCRRPNDYNPPIHWNELYDNEYYFKVCAVCDQQLKAHGTAGLFGSEFAEINKKLLNEFYSQELMKGEAAKASELGCEVLYLDPGWDTGSNQQVWDAERLGPMDRFVRNMKDDYGLQGVSLWCSLAGVPPTMGDPAACPPEARVIHADGKPDDLLLCLSSPAFLDTKEKRLLEVCRNGARFLMFDSNQFSGPCYDPKHGHAVPSTREDHAKALLELTRRVKSRYPNVLIEMHDFITGPSGIHYTPTYYGYARPHSFDCLWGHEFMWNPMSDVLSQRAVSLYYFNLAYGIPLYLHVNLKTDNENALVFWWFASTCRHLGVGGKAGGAVWEAQKKAMQVYKSLKRFYTQGTFYGLDEMVHVHTLADEGKAVINVFNLQDQPVEKEILLRLREIGLPDTAVDIEGCASAFDQDRITLKLTVPAKGQQLVKINAGKTPD